MAWTYVPESREYRETWYWNVDPKAARTSDGHVELFNEFGALDSKNLEGAVWKSHDGELSYLYLGMDQPQKLRDMMPMPDTEFGRAATVLFVQHCLTKEPCDEA